MKLFSKMAQIFFPQTLLPLLMFTQFIANYDEAPAPK